MTCQEAIILFGPTQSGKSSFIDCLLPDNYILRPELGTPGGGTVTRVCQAYRTASIGLVWDNAGYNDTALQITAADICHQTRTEVAKLGIEYAQFLVFESLRDSSVQLRATIQNLTAAFGETAKKSIVVIATNVDRALIEELPVRLDNIRKIMYEMGVGDKLVPWKNKGFTDKEFADQLTTLQLVIRAPKDLMLLDKPAFCLGDHVYQRNGSKRRKCRHGIVLGVGFDSSSHDWQLQVASLSQKKSGFFSTTRSITSTEETSSSLDRSSSQSWQKVEHAVDSSKIRRPVYSNTVEPSQTPMLVHPDDAKRLTGVRVDPPGLVLARVKFLKSHRNLIPHLLDVDSDGEGVAVWSKTGKWASMPSAAAIWRFLTFAAVLAVASTIRTQVPLAGWWGFLGYKHAVPLAVAEPLLPAAALSMVLLWVIWAIKNRNHKKHSVRLLTATFESQANNEPLVD